MNNVDPREPGGESPVEIFFDCWQCFIDRRAKQNDLVGQLLVRHRPPPGGTCRSLRSSLVTLGRGAFECHGRHRNGFPTDVDLYVATPRYRREQTTPDIEATHAHRLSYLQYWWSSWALRHRWCQGLDRLHHALPGLLGKGDRCPRRSMLPQRRQSSIQVLPRCLQERLPFVIE